MNLLEEKWIPIKRHSGAEEYIRPCEIVSHYATDPVVAVLALRPDFNASLLQFFIALIQTTFSVQLGSYERYYISPPSEEELRCAFKPYQHVFDVEGEYAFLQDCDSLTDKEAIPVASLLIDEPGEKTLKDNLDHFVKRNRIHAMSLPYAIMALMTLSWNAPSGGAGHRTSIRGGGPLTTLLVPNPDNANEQSESKGPVVTLWKTIWLNVLTESDFIGNLESEKSEESDMFPWMGATRTSDPKSGGKDTTVSDTHRLQVYWSMPRRIRLVWDKNITTNCDFDSRQKAVVAAYKTKNYGVNYVGAWLHPLTPYRYEKDGKVLPLLTPNGGISYVDWPGLVLVSSTQKQRTTPALVIQKNRLLDEYEPNIHIFGYDMDNMKARAWHERKMPCVALQEPTREVFLALVNDCIELAKCIQFNTKSAIKDALIGNVKSIDFSYINKVFLAETEHAFFAVMRRIKGSLDNKLSECPTECQNWHQELCRFSEDLFDRYVLSSNVFFSDPQKPFKSFVDLKRKNHSKKIRSLAKYMTKKGDDLHGD